MRKKYKSKDKFIIEVRLKSDTYVGDWSKVVGCETKDEAKAIKILLEDQKAGFPKEFKVTPIEFEKDDLMS